MIQLVKNGHYLIDGKPVPAKEATGATPPEAARTQTIAYNILAAHNQSGEPNQLRIKFDALISHDITFVGIIQTARASGLTGFPVPYAMTCCHNSLCAVGGTINEDDHLFGLDAAQKYGGIYVPAHMAVLRTAEAGFAAARAAPKMPSCHSIFSYSIKTNNETLDNPATRLYNGTGIYKKGHMI